MSEDPYDRAVKWTLGQPDLQELMWNTYVTHDTRNDARRFLESEEFKETARILSRLGRGAGQNYRLLDAGAGNGIASYAFAKAGYDVVAVDSSPSDIAGIEAGKKLQGLDEAAFEVSLSDIRDFQPSGEPFDIIYGRQFLHHVRDLDDVVAHLAKLLKPGGILCAVREHVIWNERQREQFLANHPLHHISQSEGAYYLKEYRSAFRKAGLEMSLELHPFASVINTYPMDMHNIWLKIESRVPRFLYPIIKTRKYSDILWRLAAWYAGYKGAQLYSFFARKKNEYLL